MNKKKLSFVLALVFSFSLGVANASYDGVNRIAEEASDAYSVNMSSSTSVSGLPSDLAACLVTAYKYVGGILVGTARADGGFNVLSHGQFLMSFNAVTGTDGQITGYKVAAIATDYSQLKSMGFDVSQYYDENGNLKEGFTEQQVLESFTAAFGGLGITVDDLKSLMTDSNGNYTAGSEPETAKWFSEAMKYLLKGENYSIQISILDAGGASCTFLENGNASYTKNSSGQTTADYFYDDQGFLDHVDSLTFEIDTDATTDSSNPVYKAAYSRTYYNEYGNASKTIEIDKNGNVVKDSDGNEIYTVSYVYSEPNGNGYLVSQTDKNDNTTYFRADGKVDHTANAKEGTTSQYHYRANGVMESIESVNKDHVTTTTIFSRSGQALGSTTKSVSSYADASDFYYEFLDKVIAAGTNKESVFAVIKSYGFDGSTGSLSIYDFMLNDSRFNTLLTVCGVTSSMRTLMLQNSNGYSALGSISKIASGSATETNTSHQSKSATDSSASRSSTVRSTSTEVTDNGLAYTSEISINIKGAAAWVFSGYCQIRAGTAVVTTTTTVGTHDPAVEGSLFPEVTDEELKEAGIDPEDEDAVAAYKEKKVQDLAEDLGIDPEDEDAMNELRNGFYTDKETGKTYAIVGANSINIMDGSGFQAASGETVFVEVTEEIKNSIIASGEKNIMFMGDVRESVDGKFLTMAMNTSYGSGFVQGDDVQAVKNEIALVSFGTAMQNGADITAQLAAYNEANDTNFTVNDVSLAYKEAADPASANNWIVSNTSANMSFFNNQSTNYKAGWELLVGKFKADKLNENGAQALF